MSDETNEPVQPQANWEPPTGDADWDQLFSAEDGSSLAATPQPAETTPAEPAPEPEPQHTAPEPQAPKRDEFFVATYRSKEAAEEAIREKDRLINDMRGKVIALAGVDPLGKRGSQELQTPTERTYLQDPDRYAKDLTDSANSKKYGDYLNAQARLIEEVVQTRFGHLIPVIEKVGRQEAQDAVSSENPAFKSFYGSEDYTKVLENRPTLKRAIQAAETNPQYQGDLPELYKLAYESNLATKTPELVNRTSSTTPTPTPRMPMSGQRLAPPTTQSGTPSKPTLNTSAGRKALMQELEAKGILDQQF